jgi:hypothetical protein
MNPRIIAVSVLTGALAIASCSSDTRSSIETDVRSAASDVADAADDAVNDAAEALARNIATQQGEEQFNNAGHELDGPLTCEATIADGVSEIEISCTGTTQAGGAAALTGTTDEIPGASVVELEGQFSGTVDGTEVFNTSSLGG